MEQFEIKADKWTIDQLNAGSTFFYLPGDALDGYKHPSVLVFGEYDNPLDPDEFSGRYVLRILVRVEFGSLHRDAPVEEMLVEVGPVPDDI